MRIRPLYPHTPTFVFRHTLLTDNESISYKRASEGGGRGEGGGEGTMDDIFQFCSAEYSETNLSSMLFSLVALISRLNTVKQCFHTIQITK